MDSRTQELIAVGASVACNCHPCLKFHTAKAREMGIKAELVEQAVEVGRKVRKGAAGQMDKLLAEISR